MDWDKNVNNLGSNFRKMWDAANNNVKKQGNKTPKTSDIVNEMVRLAKQAKAPDNYVVPSDEPTPQPTSLPENDTQLVYDVPETDPEPSQGSSEGIEPTMTVEPDPPQLVYDVPETDPEPSQGSSEGIEPTMTVEPDPPQLVYDVPETDKGETGPAEPTESPEPDDTTNINSVSNSNAKSSTKKVMVANISDIDTNKYEIVYQQKQGNKFLVVIKSKQK